MNISVSATFLLVYVTWEPCKPNELKRENLFDSTGRAQPYRRRWQLKVIMILLSSPKVERDKTVTAKEGSSGRSSEGWESHEAKCIAGWYVPWHRGIGDKNVRYRLILYWSADCLETSIRESNQKETVGRFFFYTKLQNKREEVILCILRKQENWINTRRWWRGCRISEANELKRICRLVRSDFNKYSAIKRCWYNR